MVAVEEVTAADEMSPLTEVTEPTSPFVMEIEETVNTTPPEPSADVVDHPEPIEPEPIAESIPDSIQENTDHHTFDLEAHSTDSSDPKPLPLANDDLTLEVVAHETRETP